MLSFKLEHVFVLIAFQPFHISFAVSVCLILKLNPDEMTFVLGGEMAMWTDDYCFVDQCFLYK